MKGRSSWLSLLALVAGLVLANTATAGQPKADVCHKGQVINVAVPSVPAHLAHGDYVAGAEVCNGADDDCDGEIDEGDVCCSEEVCDGVDNDCDGETDEGFVPGIECTVGTGACQVSGVTVCSEDGTGTDCDATSGEPGDEVCDDGIDNDCDGETDEDCDNGGGEVCFDDGGQCCQGEECVEPGICASDGQCFPCNCEDDCDPVTCPD